MPIYSHVTKMGVLKISLALLFLLINVVLYRQSTHLTIAHFLGYPVSGADKSDGHGYWSFRNLITTVDGPNSTTISIQTASNYSNVIQASDPPSLDEKRHPFLKEPIINPHPFNYTLFPRVNCENRDIELVICVPVSRQNFRGRQTVRDTWGSYVNVSSSKAILVFFLGSDALTSKALRDTQRRIDHEWETFGDILQESYIDHYDNLSLKSVSILKWSSTYCPKSKYVLKADDDMYINIPFLVKTLPSFDTSGNSAFVVGSVQYNARPIRNIDSKWYTPYSMFKGEVYPNYASGTAYALTIEAASLLYQASLRVPLFWLEDIYITGLCSSFSGVTVINSNYFTYGKPDASGCSFRAHISGHRYTVEEIQLIHKELYDPRKICQGLPS